MAEKPYWIAPAYQANQPVTLYDEKAAREDIAMELEKQRLLEQQRRIKEQEKDD